MVKKRKNKKTTSKKTTTKTATRKATTRKKPVKDKLSASQQPGNVTSFRVYEIDTLLREALTQQKESENLTYRSLIRKAITDEKTGVPRIVASLHAIGLAHENSKVTKVRWEIDDDVLALLRLGAAQSRVAASHLMIAALRNYCRK